MATGPSTSLCRTDASRLGGAGMHDVSRVGRGPGPAPSGRPPKSTAMLVTGANDAPAAGDLHLLRPMSDQPL
jgi:hypothetical protein